MKKQRGITLIALVITIIIMLLLAGVSIAVINRTKLYDKANEAKLEAKRSSISEYLTLKVIENSDENTLVDAKKLITDTHTSVETKQKNNKELNQYGKDVKIDDVVQTDKEVFFYVTVDKDLYKVDKNGGRFLGSLSDLKPEVSIEKASSTSSTITVTVTASQSPNGHLYYYIKGEDEAEYSKKIKKNIYETEYTFDGLEQGKTYDIKVVIESATKHTAEAVTQKTTGKVTSLKEGDIKFELDPSTWTNGKVKATAKANIDITGYKIRTSKDGETWSDSDTQEFTENGTIYAVLTDGTNYGGAATGNVTNIDKTSPVVTGVTATTDSLTIKATDEASGIVEYAISSKNEMPKNFTTVPNTKNFTETVKGIKQGTTYYVWVKDEAGNISTNDGTTNSTTTEKVTDLKQGDIKITSTPSTWTNGNVTAKAEINIDIGKFKIRTSKDGITWSDSDTQEFTENGTMYVVLWDGTNYGSSATGNITNIDKTRPVVKGVTATTDGFTIKATDEASGIVGWAYSTENKEPKDFTPVNNTKDFTTTVSKEKQGTTYYVWVKDEAGNVSSSDGTTNSTKTGKVADLSESDIKITNTPSTWTNGNVTAKAEVNTDIGNFKIRTSKDGETWSDSDTQEFTENGTMYVVLWDGTNYGGSATGNITNIDKTKPVVTSVNTTTNSITINATDEASGIVGWAYSTENKEPTEFTAVNSTKNFTTTIKNQKQGTTYYVWVKDDAGNISSGDANTNGTKTGNVTNLTEADITITTNPSEWTSGNVTATAKVNNGNGEFSLRTSKDGTTWADTDTQEFTENGTMYVVLWDGTNYGSSASKAITNIDRSKPTVSLTASTSVLTITINDVGSGVVGYAYSTENTMPTEFNSISATNNTIQIIDGLKQTTTYYVWAKDAVGNISDVQSIGTGTVPNTIDFDWTPKGWTNQDLTVTATTTETGYSIFTSTDGEHFKRTPTQTLSENGTVYALLFDGTNHSRSVSLEVGTIDKTPPPVPTVDLGNYKEGTWVGPGTISMNFTSADNLSGLKQIEISHDAKTVFAIASGQTETYDESDPNKYNWYFRAVDNAGNVSDWTSVYHIKMDSNGPSKPTVSTNGYTQDTWTKGNITLTASGSVDQGIGFDHYEWSIGDNNWKKMDSNNLVINTDMYNYIYIRGVDKLGNIGEHSDKIIVKRDATAPTTTAPTKVSINNGVLAWTTTQSSMLDIGGSQGNTIEKVKFHCTWSAGSNSSVSWNPGSWSSDWINSLGFELNFGTIYSGMTFQVWTEAQDGAGNTSTSSKVTITAP